MVVPSGFVAVVVSGVLVVVVVSGAIGSFLICPHQRGEGGSWENACSKGGPNADKGVKKSRNFVDIRSGRSLCIGVELAQAHRFTLALARCPVVSVRDSDGLPPILDPELQEAWSRI